MAEKSGAEESSRQRGLAKTLSVEADMHLVEPTITLSDLRFGMYGKLVLHR